MNFGEIVCRADHGDYRWWSALELVDYIPKGKVKAAETLRLTADKRSREDAISIAVKHSNKFRRKKK